MKERRCLDKRVLEQQGKTLSFPFQIQVLYF